MSELKRNTDSLESKARWEFIDKCSKEVDSWPDWKKPEVYPEKYKDKFCQSVYHNPPMYISIPAGEVYCHRCGSCGFEVEIRGSSVYI